MNRLSAALVIVAAAVGVAWADAPAVTVYNQDFGVVRERIALDLKAGVNDLTFNDITAHVEPSSVVLRDPSGERQLQVLEQNYRADPLSQELLLNVFEGQTIDFLLYNTQLPPEAQIVRGRIVRSGFVPHYRGWQEYGQQYAQRQSAYSYNGGGQPIIEVDGKLRFGLPGTPLFPSLGDDTILKPTLNWKLATDTPGAFPAELSYMTSGMSWKADYNVIAPPEGDVVDVVGWVTIDNQSGKDFIDARIKLMAGDVSKIEPDQSRFGVMRNAGMFEAREAGPTVTEKAFDEYHLYTLERQTTLRDRETKQVEFVRGSGVQSQRVYVYDGAKIDWRRYSGWDPMSLRVQKELGTECNPKVWVVREIWNKADNGLGIPLPAGRVRFYRQGDDRQLEFVGENEIDHTPSDELLRIYTGNAFDLVGERKRTNFNVDRSNEWVDETFEIEVRNHEATAVTVQIVEHLYRWWNWEIRDASHEYTKRDARTAEFPVEVPANGATKVTYTVHYSW